MMRELHNTRMTETDLRLLPKCWHRIFVLLILSIGITAGHSAEGVELQVEIDRSELRHQSGPNKDDTAGSLSSRTGSYARGVELLRNSFALSGDSKGTVSIEIAMFPRGYRYAAHDLFGLLSKGSDVVKCGGWVFTDRTSGGNVCYYSHNQDGQTQKGGVVWLHGDKGEKSVTVLIGYTGLTGLPGQVIDKYLREYPSSVPENPTWHHNWEMKDIEKWKDVLQANKDDVRMLQAGAIHLMRYDKRSFGLLQAIRQRGNPSKFSEALKGVNERMDDWVTKRKKAKESGQRED